jgi:alpha-methylacyl-CoA racemase
MLLAFGIVCGIVEAARSGRGQVVDAAMVDGAALLAGMMHGLRAAGQWGERGTNLLDSGAWFYEVYETADGRYVALGAIDERSRAELLRHLGLADDGGGGGALPDQDDRASWPAMKARVAAVMKTRTRDQWCALLEGTDACLTPVLDAGEAPEHPHLHERETFVELGGVVQPAPAPRFTRTPGAVDAPPPAPGEHTTEALLDWGFSTTEIDALRAEEAIR